MPACVYTDLRYCRRCDRQSKACKGGAFLVATGTSTSTDDSFVDPPHGYGINNVPFALDPHDAVFQKLKYMANTQKQPPRWDEVARLLNFQPIVESDEWTTIVGADKLLLPPYPSVPEKAFKWPGSAQKAKDMLAAAIVAHRANTDRPVVKKAEGRATRAATKVIEAPVEPEVEEPSPKRKWYASRS